MIGNKYLRDLFEYSDEDTSINQLLELLKFRDVEFIDSLEHEPVNLGACNNEEIKYLTKVSALIDYYLQLHGLEVPDWLRDNRFPLLLKGIKSNIKYPSQIDISFSALIFCFPYLAMETLREFCYLCCP